MRATIFLLAILQLASCQKGFKGNNKANLPPKTFMVSDTIVRAEANRYTSQVHIQWWGSDPDGYVVRYKLSTDLKIWSSTTKTDSIFSLQLPAGSDSFDFRIFIKAVDNEDLEDPGYATLVYPTRNSAPTISFVNPNGGAGITTRNPVRSLPMLKYYFSPIDPDGSDDLDRTELVLNDTTKPLYVLPPNYKEIVLKAATPKATSSICKVLTGSSLTEQPTALVGLKLNDTNILYVRSVDRVGSKSKWVAAKPIYVKQQHSDILLVNGYTGSSRLSVQSFFASAILKGNTALDTLQASEVVNSNYTELASDNVTQALQFSLYKHILWFTDDANSNLSFAQKNSGSFFANGGTMFMSVGFSTNFDTTAGHLGFTPASRLVPSLTGQTFRMVSGATVSPIPAGWPTLSANASPFIARSVFQFDNSPSYTYQYLYNGQITITGVGANPTWQQVDSTNLVLKRTNTNSTKTDFIFSSVPIEKLDGNNNIDLFFKKALKDELGF